jgi:hypothetical protein
MNFLDEKECGVLHFYNDDILTNRLHYKRNLQIGNSVKYTVFTAP